MNILFFIVVFSLLIFIHEFGHFFFAKLFGLRVDEFGFGYPPRLCTLFHWKGTRFSLNWIPFGGFVRILGENPLSNDLGKEEKKYSLSGQKKWKQLLVMFGGILFNLIFAWVLLVFLYAFHGKDNYVPVSSFPHYNFTDSKLVITAVKESYPAYVAGIKAGDELKEYYSGTDDIIVEDEGFKEFRRFVQRHEKEEIGMVVYRDQSKLKNFLIKAKQVDGKYYLGIRVERLGKFQPGFLQSIKYGTLETFDILKQTVHAFYKLIRGQIPLDSLSGPVGIVREIGMAANTGMRSLIFFIALLSINLAVLNFIPFPALDGGRILFILVETITGRKIPAKIALWMNMIGFFLLILLMIVVTYKDIARIW